MHSDDADASDPPTEDQLRRVYGHRSMAARAMPAALQPADPALVLQLQEMGFPGEMVRLRNQDSETQRSRLSCESAALRVR
jgi:hypothetical protein